MAHNCEYEPWAFMKKGWVRFS